MVRALSLHICIIGGGFGGLYTALYLQKYRHLRNCRITLIEPKAQFLFTPMMYELITDELKDWEIAPTYSSLIAGKNIQWRQISASSVDLDAQTLTLEDDSSLSYDYLVIARGADSRPVDIPGVDEHTLTFRSFQDTQRLRARLAQLVQAQASQAEPQPVNVVVVGGGPSGVELACKVSDYLRDRHITYRTTLIDRGDTILKPFAKGLKKLGARSLLQRGVRLLTETSVQKVKPQAVVVERAEQSGATQSQVIPSDLTLWAVGTQPKPWLGVQPIKHNEQGQRLTRRSLQLLDRDNVFTLGDGADIRGSRQTPAPNTAQAAFQGASRVAANLARMAQGKQPKPFNYLHLGDMITLGIGNAGLHSFGLTLGGKLAALCRRGVYIFRMPTRQHQVKVARRALGELFRAIFLLR